MCNGQTCEKDSCNPCRKSNCVERQNLFNHRNNLSRNNFARCMSHGACNALLCNFFRLNGALRKKKKSWTKHKVSWRLGLGLHVRWLFALWSDWMTCLENQKKDVNQSNLLEIDNCRICAVLCSTLSSRTRHRLFNRCIVAISFSERVCQCYNPLSADKHRNTRRTLAKVSTPMFPVAIPATEKDPIKNHLRRKVVKTLTWMVSYR